MDCRVFTLTIVLLLTSCAVENVGPEQEAQPMVETRETLRAPTPTQPVRWECEDPRPTKCGTQTVPVCSTAGSEYRNECYACRDPTVAGYTDGPCA